jgi:hypothetical protein
MKNQYLQIFKSSRGEDDSIGEKRSMKGGLTIFLCLNLNKGILSVFCVRKFQHISIRHFSLRPYSRSAHFCTALTERSMRRKKSSISTMSDDFKGTVARKSNGILYYKFEFLAIFNKIHSAL